MANDFWQRAGTIALPALGNMFADKRTQGALDKQLEGADQASSTIRDSMGQQQKLYDPLISMGDEYLNILRGGIQSGLLEGGDIFSGYKPFQYQQIQQGQGYQAPDRPDMGQRPDFYTAGDAPTAGYYDPNAQYQGREFNYDAATDPVAQQRIQQANQASQTSAAARGMQLSGAHLKELQQNAGDITADASEKAWQRHMAEDATGYGRWSDQQSRLSDASRYQNEDQYRRYLDSVGIRGSEADRAIGQWNMDRGFNQGTFESDRGFGYGQHRDTEGDRWMQHLTGQQFGQQGAADDYARRMDEYSRRMNQWGTIGQLANMGMTGRQGLSQAMTSGYGSLADLQIQRGNAYAAAAADRNSRSGLLNMLGI
jgi:hypothetical protein